MSDTANVARDQYLQYSARTRTMTDLRIGGATTVEEPEDMHRAARNLSPYDLLTLHAARPRQSEAHRVPGATPGEHYIIRVFMEGSENFSREVTRDTREWGLVSDTTPYLSGSMMRQMPARPAFGAELLLEALSDLDTLSEAAREDDLPEPDAEAVANARTLLPKLYDVLPVRYQVSPTERRGVAIDAPMKWGASVAVECAPDDTVYCFAAIDGNSRRAKFYQMDGLPDVFIEKALRDLAAG